MSTLRKGVRGTVDLTVGQILSNGCSFVRLAILARLLGKEDFGIAATFAITTTMLEMASNMSVNVLMVQSKNGNDERFENTAHTLQAIRGVINAIVLFLLASPVSYYFGIPEARWAFQYLALVPLIQGFVHLDINRLEREMNFRPKILTEVAPQIAITVAAWPMAVWLRDYSALLWLLLIKAAFALIASHCLSKRRYRWGWHKFCLREVLSFGWPLLINGILLFVITQGDRIAIGAFYSMSALGTFSVAVGLVAAAGNALVVVSKGVLLPVLSRTQDERDVFVERYRDTVRIMVILASLVGPMFIVFGRPFVIFVYGAKYVDAGILVALLGAAEAFRLVRLAPILTAMAKGDTTCALLSNVFRLVGVGLAFALAYAGSDLAWIAAAATLAECATLVAANQILCLRHGTRASICYEPLFVPIVGMSLATFTIFLPTGGLRLLIGAIGFLVWGGICFAIFQKWYPFTMGRIGSLVIDIRKRIWIPAN